MMRVAAELDIPGAAHEASAAASVDIPVSAQTLALARKLAHRHDADVALAPDGTLFVAHSRAGAVWRIRRSPL